MSSQLSEQNQQLYKERLQTQIETDKQIITLIKEAVKDPKKHVPYGPVLMNLYNQERIQAHQSALRKTINDERKNYCNKKCQGGKDDCLNKCEKFFSLAVLVGMKHFKSVHKYAYTPTVKNQEE